MIGYLLIGCAILAAVLALVHLIANSKPGDVLTVLKWVFVILLVVVTALLVARGQFHFLWLLAVGALPWIMRLRGLRNMWKTMRGPTPGQASRVRTDALEMTLDHETGEMDGTVLTGRFEGRRLSELPLEACLDLLDDLYGDIQSTNLMEAYLDRTHGTEWRAQYQAQGGKTSEDQQGEDAGRRQSGNGQTGPMTREEAWAILGLEPGAEREEIRQAHRRLMKQVHPDHGGSDYLAAKINEAKDILLH